MGKLKYIVVSVLVVAMAGFLYNPLPPHLEHRWRLQLFFTNTKLVFTWCELKYRLGLVERIPAFRAGMASVMSAPLTQQDKESLKILDRTIEGVPVRIYQPKYVSGSVPGLVYIHGGGWMMFDIDMYDGVCARIARETNTIVVSVAYRLAPEHPFPAGFNDCYKVALFALQHGQDIGLDSSRIALAGDSAGGNLAATVMLKLRDDKIRPSLKAHVSIYPTLQFTNTYMPVHEVREKYGGKMIQIFSLFVGSYLNLTESQRALLTAQQFLTPEMKAKSDRLVDISLLPKHLIPDDYKPGSCQATTVTDDVVHINSFLDDTRIAPLMSEDLGNLPPSLVVAAEWDTLRDENIIFAERMKRAGNKVRLLYLDKSFHGVLNLFDQFESGIVLMNEMIDFLKKEVSSV